MVPTMAPTITNKSPKSNPKDMAKVIIKLGVWGARSWEDTTWQSCFRLDTHVEASYVVTYATHSQDDPFHLAAIPGAESEVGLEEEEEEEEEEEQNRRP